AVESSARRGWKNSLTRRVHEGDMVATSRTAALTTVSFIVFAAGCAHAPQVASLTSAQAPKPAAIEAPKPEPTPPPAQPAQEEAAPKPKKAPEQAFSFEALSAQLGDENKMALDSEHLGDGSSDVPTTKGLSANGYTSVGPAHQAVPDTQDNRGDVKVSGGITVAQVRTTVNDGKARLRHCYERGLAN